MGGAGPRLLELQEGPSEEVTRSHGDVWESGALGRGPQGWSRAGTFREQPGSQ